MKTWEITTGGKILAEVKIQRGIFHWDALLVMAMMTYEGNILKALNFKNHKRLILFCTWTSWRRFQNKQKMRTISILVKLVTFVEGDLRAPFSIATTPRCRGGRYPIPWIAPLYRWSLTYNAEFKQGGIKYHFLSLWYDLTWDWTPVSQTTSEHYLLSQDIGMKFGKEKCAMLIIKSGKREITKGIELPNQERIRTLGEKENYYYLGILETDTVKQVEIKAKNKKTRKFLETKLWSINLIIRINTWVVSLVRFSGLFLQWTKKKSLTNGTEDKKVDDNA